MVPDDPLAVAPIPPERSARGALAATGRWLAGLVGIGAALLALPAGASAQDATLCPRGFTGNSTTVFGFTCARLPDAFVDVPITRRVDTFRTQIVGVLDGVGAFYDTTFAAPFLDPIVQAGLDAARAAIDLASDDPLDFAGPVRTDAGVLLLASSVGDPVIVGSPTESRVTAVEGIIGSALGLVARSGDLGRCLGTTAQGFPTGCSGGDPFEYLVPLGQQALVSHSLSTFTFTREIVTTQTWETFERWEIVGTPRDAGQVPLPGSLALLGAGLVGTAAIALRRRSG